MYPCTSNLFFTNVFRIFKLIALIALINGTQQITLLFGSALTNVFSFNESETYDVFSLNKLI